jgi:hypothetical protein
MIPALRQASRFALRATLALVCLAPGSAGALGNSALPQVISGEVLRMRGQWMTKSQPAELLLPGGGRITIHSSTDASVLTDPQALMLLPGKKTPTYSIILRRGLVDIEVPNENPARVAVAIGAPGDLRFVTLTGQSSVKVDGRNVIVVSHSGLTTVTQGTKVVRLPLTVKRIYPRLGAFADHPLLEATRWIGGRRVWIATANAPVPVSGYVWAPVQGASGYVVALRERATQHLLTTTRTKEPVVEAFPQPLAPGKYELDIAAVDGDGIASNNQTKLPVTVVGLELPGGAVALPKDTVVVASEQQVRLTHAEGLTLTTAAHKTGVPASEPFGLEGLDRAAILIHPPGGGDTATLTLVRREPLVSTWVGPKLATWPEDPVELQVSFVDSRGRPTPRHVESTVRVLVGVEPIDVAWDRQGSLWQARIPSLKGSGPWVVRLEVVDQYGIVIGRDFAEITKTRGRSRFTELDPNALAQKPATSGTQNR